MYSGNSSGGNDDYTKGPPYAHHIGASSSSADHESQDASAIYSQHGGSSGAAVSGHQHHLLQNYQIAPNFQQRELEAQYLQQQQRLVRYNHPQAEQWPQYYSASHPPSYSTPRINSSITVDAAGLRSREEDQHLLMNAASSQSPYLQGLSPIEQFLYNEQLMLRMQTAGVEPVSAYDNVAISSASSDYAIAAAAAAGRYHEEACTPRPRWSPTQEQIQILESLFNSGTTTPSRDMIVEIAGQLRKYGTIAEANVFYWFQNRKARAKRKQLQPPVPPA